MLYQKIAAGNYQGMIVVALLLEMLAVAVAWSLRQAVAVVMMAKAVDRVDMADMAGMAVLTDRVGRMVEQEIQIALAALEVCHTRLQSYLVA